MPAQPSDLLSLARFKLHLAIGGKDNCDLHRWVLLKNSLVHPQSEVVHPAVSNPSRAPPVCHAHHYNGDSDEDDEVDSFMFPDASEIALRNSSDAESEWLDSLLEELEDPDDDDIRVSVVPAEDDEDHHLSPLISPMSSSDDLLNHADYFPPPIAFPYPVPYPPLHHPLSDSYDLGPIVSPPHISPPAYDALPYYDSDDLDDLSVPEAIEDTSDDESDAPSTPSLGRSSSLEFPDSASVRMLDGRQQPHVYIRTPDSYIGRLDIDPLPFPDEDHFTYNGIYQQC